jgi:hypothetical protein
MIARLAEEESSRQGDVPMGPAHRSALASCHSGLQIHLINARQKHRLISSQMHRAMHDTLYS